jgi:hypothetical protein
MRIIYTGTPPSIKAGGIAFIQGHPTEVPEMVAELLLKKPFFTAEPIPDPTPEEENSSQKRSK